MKYVTSLICAFLFTITYAISNKPSTIEVSNAIIRYQKQNSSRFLVCRENHIFRKDIKYYSSAGTDNRTALSALEKLQKLGYIKLGRQVRDSNLAYYSRAIVYLDKFKKHFDLRSDGTYQYVCFGRAGSDKIINFQYDSDTKITVYTDAKVSIYADWYNDDIIRNAIYEHNTFVPIELKGIYELALMNTGWEVIPSNSYPYRTKEGVYINLVE